MEEIKIQRAAKLKEKPDPKSLGFGKIFSDHMFLLDYHAGQGWHDPRIVPYGPFMLDPSAMVLHYAQEVFEGLKAYRAPDGSATMAQISAFHPSATSGFPFASNNNQYLAYRSKSPP